MFTGIVTDIGAIKSLKKDGDLRAVIQTSYDMSGVAVGASIACSGVCLTVVEKTVGSFTVDISAETIACTNISQWQEGTKINLERAMRLGDEFGGHIVSGHVDGIAVVEKIERVDASHRIRFSVPENLAIFVAAKGSIALDGISLTVNKVEGNSFEINIIPHTWEKTTVSNLSVGSKVNLEVDMLARYVARMKEVG